MPIAFVLFDTYNVLVVLGGLLNKLHYLASRASTYMICGIRESYDA